MATLLLSNDGGTKTCQDERTLERPGARNELGMETRKSSLSKILRGQFAESGGNRCTAGDNLQGLWKLTNPNPVTPVTPATLLAATGTPFAPLGLLGVSLLGFGFALCVKAKRRREI